MPAGRAQVPTSMLLDTVGRDKVKRSAVQQILQLALPEVYPASNSAPRGLWQLAAVARQALAGGGIHTRHTWHVEWQCKRVLVLLPTFSDVALAFNAFREQDEQYKGSTLRLARELYK